MATGTFHWFAKGLEHLVDADLDWVADTIKVSLHTSAYSPNQDTHDYRDDLTNEVSGTGYTAGGATLANKTAVADAAIHGVRLKADDVAWANSTITNARVAVLSKIRGGAASADELLGYCVFDADVSSAAGTFTLDFDATNGILTLAGS